MDELTGWGRRVGGRVRLLVWPLVTGLVLPVQLRTPQPTKPAPNRPNPIDPPNHSGLSRPNAHPPLRPKKYPREHMDTETMLCGRHNAAAKEHNNRQNERVFLYLSRFVG